MKALCLAAAIAATLVSMPASAELYAGAGLGSSKTNSSHTSGKVFAGYQYSPTWATEFAYTDLGDYHHSSSVSRSLAMVGTMPFATNWSLLGKLGLTSNRTHFAGASNHTAPLLGLGVGYSVSKTMAMRLEYESFGKLSDARNVNDSTGTNLGLSVKYLF